jgi:hypothetical protein
MGDLEGPMRHTQNTAVMWAGQPLPSRADILARLNVSDVYPDVEFRFVGPEWWRGPCPFHDGTRPDSFRVSTSTLNWWCMSECQTSGSAFDYLMRRDGIDFAEAATRLAARAGLDSPKPRPVLPKASTTTVAHPDRFEVGILWTTSLPIAMHTVPVEATYLTNRGIDIGRVEDSHLAGALPPGAELTWDIRDEDGTHIRPAGFSIILPLFDVAGDLRNLRCRPPWRVVKGMKAFSSSCTGLVLADAGAQQWLKGDNTMLAGGLVIAEGDIDFLKAATNFSDADESAPSAIGITSGGWTQAYADKVPDGTPVIFLDQGDKAASEFASRIEATLQGRALFVRQEAPRD